MSFKTIISFPISSSVKYKKDISVVSFLDSEGKERKFIDLRLKYIDSNNEEYNTKRGVTLRGYDIDNLLPIWLSGFDDEYFYVSPDNPDLNRSLSFKRVGDMHELKIKKRTSFGEKEQSVLVTINDLVEIAKIKDELLDNLK